jgi:hypothetical protein
MFVSGTKRPPAGARGRLKVTHFWGDQPGGLLVKLLAPGWCEMLLELFAVTTAFVFALVFVLYLVMRTVPERR